MRFALLNPNWNFDGSVYFGCREPHLPLELAYAKSALERHGHEAVLINGHMEGLNPAEVKDRLAAFKPDVTILETAPTYLFWRCAQPELAVPLALAREIRRDTDALVIVGPHASATPRAAMRKLGADAALLGEFEDVAPQLCGNWDAIPSLSMRSDNGARIAVPHAADLKELPALYWPEKAISGHTHHHHRFDSPWRESPAAEIEASRGCPFDCVFCAKENFRNGYRKRPLDEVVAEMAGLASRGAKYLYFIDEIFLPDKDLINAISQMGIKFGIQTRIDLWREDQLRELGNAGCVSIEAGVESVTDEGRMSLGKKCRVSGERLMALLIEAKRHVPFVQANLIKAGNEGPEAASAWRRELLRYGVWANDPVPVFPYPGSPIYRAMWGQPDDWAWERASGHYMSVSKGAGLSDLQDKNPLGLEELERANNG